MRTKSQTPPSPSWGWIAVIATFATLGLGGVTLAIFFRDSADPDEISVRERRQTADQVCYSVVFSPVDVSKQFRIIDGISADVGSDSSSTDLVLGSTATDPWCTSMADYQSSLALAMTKSSRLRLGKQTLILSMIGGIMTKNQLPATIYLIGNMQDTLTSGVINRTLQTIAAFEVRNEVHAPIRVVSYMDTAATRANAEYSGLFRGRVFNFEQR